MWAKHFATTTQTLHCTLGMAMRSAATTAAAAAVRSGSRRSFFCTLNCTAVDYHHSPPQQNYHVTANENNKSQRETTKSGTENQTSSTAPTSGLSFLGNQSPTPRADSQLFLSGGAENLRAQKYLVGAVRKFIGNVGSKLGFAHTKSVASNLNFRSSIHSAGPNNYENGRASEREGERDTRTIEREGSTATLQMGLNARPTLLDKATTERERNPRPLGMGWNNSPIEMGIDNRPTPMGRNPGSFFMGWNNRPFELGVDNRPTPMGRNGGSFAMDWNINLAEPARDSRSMNFVRSILDVNGRDMNFGPPQSPRVSVEQNANIVHIKLLRNNTFITITDSKGNKKAGASSGCLADKKGGRTRYGSEATAEYVGRLAKNMGLKSVVVKVNGFTHFKKKKQAILSFRDGYTNNRSDQNPVVYIEDTTRRPHNGCRLRKKCRI